MYDNDNKSKKNKEENEEKEREQVRGSRMEENEGSGNVTIRPKDQETEKIMYDNDNKSKKNKEENEEKEREQVRKPRVEENEVRGEVSGERMIRFGKVKNIINVKRLRTTEGKQNKKGGTADYVPNSASMIELYCGNEKEGGAGITRALTRKGVMCETPVGEDAGKGTIINKNWIKGELRTILKRGKVKLTFIALPCKVWSTLTNFIKKDSEKWDEIERARKVWVDEHINPLISVLNSFVEKGGVVMFEHPEKSAMWEIKEMKEAMAKWNGHKFQIDMCNHGSECQKPTTILTSARFDHPLMKDLRQHELGTFRCNHEKHAKQALGAVAKAAQFYPAKFADTIAGCMKRWLRGGEIQLQVAKCKVVRGYQQGAEMTERAVIDSGSAAGLFPKEKVMVLKRHGTQFETEGMGKEKGTSIFDIASIAIVVEGKSGEEKILILNAVGITMKSGEASEANIIDPMQFDECGGTWKGVTELANEPAFISGNGKIFPLMTVNGEVVLPYRAANSNDFKRLGGPLVVTKQTEFWSKKDYLDKASTGGDRSEVNAGESAKIRKCTLVASKKVTTREEETRLESLSGERGQREKATGDEDLLNKERGTGDEVEGLPGKSTVVESKHNELEKGQREETQGDEDPLNEAMGTGDEFEVLPGKSKVAESKHSELEISTGRQPSEGEQSRRLGARGEAAPPNETRGRGESDRAISVESKHSELEISAGRWPSEREKSLRLGARGEAAPPNEVEGARRLIEVLPGKTTDAESKHSEVETSAGRRSGDGEKPRGPGSQEETTQRRVTWDLGEKEPATNYDSTLEEERRRLRGREQRKQQRELVDLDSGERSTKRTKVEDPGNTDKMIEEFHERWEKQSNREGVGEKQATKGVRMTSDDDEEMRSTEDYWAEIIRQEEKSTETIEFKREDYYDNHSEGETDEEDDDEESEDEESKRTTKTSVKMMAIDQSASPTKRGGTKERTSKGKVKLDSKNMIGQSPAQLLLAQDYNTLLANRRNFSAGVQNHKAFPPLSMLRVNTTMSVDPIDLKPSRGGHNYAIVIRYAKSNFVVVEGVASITGGTIATVLRRTWKNHGIPTMMRTDSGTNLTGGAVAELCNTYMVEQTFSEPRKQYQNTVEGTIGQLKQKRKILRDINIRNGGVILEDEEMDELRHIVEVHNHSVYNDKYGRPAGEKHHGITLDISHLNLYHFGQIVEIYRPDQKSETCSGWVEGRFIGTAPNVGNVMCIMVRQNDNVGKWRGRIMATSNHRPRTGRPGEEQGDVRPPLPEYWMRCVGNEEQFDDLSEEESKGIRDMVRKANEEMEKENMEDEGENKNDEDKSDTEEDEEEEAVEENNGDVWYEIEALKRFKIVNGGEDAKIEIAWKPDGKTGKKWKNTFTSYIFKGDGLAFQAESNLGLGAELAHLILEKMNNKCPKAAVWATAFLKKLYEDGLAEEEEGKEQDEVTVRRARCIIKCKSMTSGEMTRWAESVVKETDSTTTADLTGKARVTTSEWQFGVRVPRGKKEAERHDAEYDSDARKEKPCYAALIGKRRWRLAMEKEMAKFMALDIGTHEESALRVLGRGARAPSNYQEVRCFWVFTVKPDGELKARWVAGGNKVDSRGVPSSMTVISAVGVRMMFAQAAADGQKVLAGDLGNAYLHARTREKVFCRLEEEWGPEYAGRVAVIEKAIYGLVSSAYEFHSYVVRAMDGMGWTQAEACKDIWFRWNERDGKYDRVGFYVDDVIITGMHPEEIVMEMEKHFEFKFSGRADAYLGSEIKHDKVSGTHFSSERYVKGAVERVETEIGEESMRSKREEWERENRGLGGGEREDAWREICKAEGSKRLARKNMPMSPNLRPEGLVGEDARILGEGGRRIYQSKVGILVWIVTLGRFDIGYAVSTLGQFNSQPQVGHENAVRYIFGYLKKEPNLPLYIDTTEIMGLPEKYESSDQVRMHERYPHAEEDRSEREPVGTGVDCGLTVFADASHADDEQRRSVTGVIGFYGSMPIFWSSKRQKVIAGSTYEAEFLALRAAIDEVRGIRYLMRSMGVRVVKGARVLGDNEGVLQSAAYYGSGLNKKHVGISYHRCREAVACGIVTLHKIPSKENVSDMMTKPLGGETLRELLRLSGSVRKESTNDTTSGE